MFWNSVRLYSNQMNRSTPQTAISISLSMIGTALIVFPLNYLNEGIFENLIFLVIMGLILGLTCSIYAMHLRPQEKDITQSIRRIAGEKHFKVAALMSGVEVFLVSCVSYLLASDILYDVVTALTADFFLSELAFRFILMGIFAVMTWINDITFAFKLSSVAFASLVISTLILVGSLPLNLKNLDMGVIELKQVSLHGILTVASINGFAFTCHPSISPIIKAHKDQKSNRKAVIWGFAITMLIYMFVGLAGCLAIYGLKPIKTANVMDYFVGQWQAPAIGLTSVVYFVLVFPIFPYVSKNQLTSLFSKQTQNKPYFKSYVRYVFFLGWILVNTFFTLTDANPKVVMGFMGSVVSSYFVYFLPVYMTFITRGVFKAQETLVTDQNPQITQGLIAGQEAHPQNWKQKIFSQKIDQEEASYSIITTTESFSSIIIEEIQQKTTKSEPKPLSIPQKIGYVMIVVTGFTLFVSDIISLIEEDM